jgi:uncharacterized protein YcbK (DUF882 family)
LVSLLLLAGAGSVHDAAAENETRTLSFHHTHSNEDLTITFKRNGRYDEAALKQLNHYLRDWRTQDQTVMDPHLFDILWEVYRDVDGRKPIQIVSAYRSPGTNAMLRSRRSSGVARYSQHMLGHAMDFFIPDVPLEQIRYAGLRLQRGGVGFYPTSGSPFVHLDTGSIRHWPRMTHDQLARVFPDGRTVHVPSDGVPLKGYELARAEIEKRDGDDRATTRTSLSMWDRFFKGRSGDDEDDAADAPAIIKVADVTTGKPADSRPAVRAKPRGISAMLQLAAADSQLAQADKQRPAEQTSAEQTSSDDSAAKPQTPEDIINARGFWGNIPAPAKQPTPAQVAAIKAREASGSGEPPSTASIGQAFQALAYMPAPGDRSGDRPQVVTASTPAPRDERSAPRDETQATGSISSIIAKDQGQPSPGGAIATATRISVAKGNDIWLRALMLAPSTSSSMLTTVFGDTDMTRMRDFFVKPPITIAMDFSKDPQMGLQCDHFSGSVTAKLKTASFAVQSAALH